MTGLDQFDDVLMTRRIFCRGESKNGQNAEAGQAWEYLDQLWIVTVTGLAIVHSAKRLAQKHPNPYSEPNSGKLSLGLSKCVALWIVTSRMLPSPPLKLRNLHLPVVDGTEEEAYANREVYDDCDVPLGIVSAHLLSSVETNFAVGDNGGITRSGNAEAEDEDNMPPVLGRGQRKKVPTRRYQGPVFGGALDFFFTYFGGDFVEILAAQKSILHPFKASKI
ncbi:hypothetical protein C8R45DRAFT_1073708 [Mycena sanguinolenta]|nr:hypothetical protein C8R45DRAFT_1073708 [Mycena sanguinolenta]